MSPASGDIPGCTTQHNTTCCQTDREPPVSCCIPSPFSKAGCCVSGTNPHAANAQCLTMEGDGSNWRQSQLLSPGSGFPQQMVRSLPSPPASLVQLQPPLCSPSGCWQEKTAGGSQPWIPPDLPPSTAASERHRAANAFGSSAPTAVVLWNTKDHRQRFTVGLERQ